MWATAETPARHGTPLARNWVGGRSKECLHEKRNADDADRDRQPSRKLFGYVIGAREFHAALDMLWRRVHSTRCNVEKIRLHNATRASALHEPSTHSPCAGWTSKES